MEIPAKQPTAKGPAEMFTGDVYLDPIVRGEEPSRLRMSAVHFTPSARTAWHSHAVGQTLYVLEGRGLIQSRGGEVTEIHPGEVILTPPDEWHWHGAAPDHFMTHLTITEGPGDDRPNRTGASTSPTRSTAAAEGQRWTARVITAATAKDRMDADIQLAGVKPIASPIEVQVEAHHET